MKPFKGVIRDWTRLSSKGGVLGKTVWHRDHTVIPPKFVPGGDIFTSNVVSLEDRDSFTLCETENSFYILIDKAGPT